MSEKSENLKKNLMSASTWSRAFFLVLFTVAFFIAEIVVGAIMLFQLGSKLITGKTNDQLITLGKRLSTYAYQIQLFVTYNTETKPFPFDGWPKAEVLIPSYAISTPPVKAESISDTSYPVMGDAAAAGSAQQSTTASSDTKKSTDDSSPAVTSDKIPAPA